MRYPLEYELVQMIAHLLTFSMVHVTRKDKFHDGTSDNRIELDSGGNRFLSEQGQAF
jgi:hypothetical protein